MNRLMKFTNTEHVEATVHALNPPVVPYIFTRMTRWRTKWPPIRNLPHGNEKALRHFRNRIVVAAVDSAVASSIEGVIIAFKVWPTRSMAYEVL